MSINQRYRLRLLSGSARCYEDDSILRTLARRGLVLPTGRVDGAGRAEWAITDAGRMALATADGRR